MKNPIYGSVEDEIFLAKEGLSEFELIKILEKKEIFSFLSGNDSELLFKKHFLVMNALYQIQKQLLSSKDYNLYVSPLKIKISPYVNNLSLGALSQEYDDSVILRDYYLNMNNLSTKADEIAEMLNSFWKNFNTRLNIDEKSLSKSYGVLGLETGASKTQVQHAYRQLVGKHHPDKGGDKERFVSIRKAYEILCR